MHGFLRRAGATLIAIGIVAIIVVAARSAIFAPNAACVGRSRELIAALQQYVQDNDEDFPPQMTTAAGFKAAVLPYAMNASLFICPATNKPYAPDTALAGQWFAAFNQGTTVAFEDSVPHSDGEKTVTYLDGTVNHGGVVQGNLTLLGMQNVSELVLATGQYIQDNDEHLPPTDTQANFQAAVGTYVPSSRDFYSPATGQPYAPNPNISEMGLAAFPQPDQIVVVQSSVPEPDGLLTIGYLDGHVVHGPLTIPSGGGSSTGNIRQLMLAVLQYTQDYDQVLPPTGSYSAFENALMPYVRSSNIFYDPRTGLPYILNRNMSRKPLSDFPDPTAVVAIKAPNLDQYGILAVGYLNGVVVQRAYHIVRTMTVGADNSTRLFWSRQGGLPAHQYGSESMWAVDANGGVIDKVSLGRGLIPVSAEVDSSDTVRLLSNNLDIQAYPYSASEFEIVGAGAETAVSASDRVNTKLFGPFDGWTPTAIGAGANDQPVALWDYYDGTAAVWLMSTSGDYTDSVDLSPPSGGSAVDLAVGADNNIHVLWANSDGGATIQTLNSAGVSQSMASFGPLSGYAPAGLIVGPSGNLRLLWNGTDGSASVWTINTSGKLLGKQDFAGQTSWHAAKIGVGDDGKLRILWINIDDTARLDIVDRAGEVISSTYYQPYYTG